MTLLPGRHLTGLARRQPDEARARALDALAAWRLSPEPGEAPRPLFREAARLIAQALASDEPDVRA